MTGTVVATLDTGVLTRTSAGRICLNGKYAYIAGGRGLAIVDISTPAFPKKVVKLNTNVLTRMGGGSVQVIGDRAYVCGGNGAGGALLALATIDISDPENAKVVSTMDTDQAARLVRPRKSDALRSALMCPFVPPLPQSGGHVAIGPGGMLYVTGGSSVAIFDTANHTALPSKVATVETGVLSHEASGFSVVSGKHLFVGGAYGLTVVDVSDHTSPRIVSKAYSDVGTAAGGNCVALFGR